MLQPVAAEGVDLFERSEGADLRVDAEAGVAQEIERFGVAAQRRAALDVAHLIREERELAPSGDLRVLLAEGSGRRVAGVGEQALARLALLLVELLECRQRHVDLAPHLDGSRKALALQGQALGHHFDGAHVGGHVLAGDAIAAGGRPRVPPVLVEDRHGQAVDFELTHEIDVARDVALHALAPRQELLEGEGVVERHHRSAVAHGREGRGVRSGAHLLSGRVGRHQVGVCLLDRPQLADQGVVLGVGDLGVVELVVADVVMFDLLPQLFGSGSRVAGSHEFEPTAGV